MAEHNKQLAIISADSRELNGWLSVLEETGWTVNGAQSVDQAVSQDMLKANGVILYDTGTATCKLDGPLQKYCRLGSETAVIPILTDPVARDVTHCIHQGAADVLIKPFDSTELLSTVTRASDFRNLSQKYFIYRDKLERANRELRESLDILRMDQLAGRQVQQSMLPPSPMRHGEYEIAHYIVPSLYLSGDFVGYNILFDRYLLFYFADVSGHGASSAFVTVLLRFILKQIIRRHRMNQDHTAVARAPEGFVEHINRQIIATGLEKHLTIFAGSIDMQRNMLRYAIGAHLPMPVFVTGDDARFLPGKGKPVGLFEDATWEVQEIALPRRFSLVIASDGLLDFLEGGDLEAKEQNLVTAVSRGGMSHEAICRELGMEDVKDAPDDVSVLTVTRGG